MKNEKCTLKDLEYAKKLKITENEIHTLGAWNISEEKLKKGGKFKISTVGRGIYKRKLKIMENETSASDEKYMKSLKSVKK